ncbi:esterase/lipase family protein [Oceanicoccus sagamiensis]|uniref:GPI inositol-deacylase PGAP1-like alpha/beta domain-containing protein n=1 Tax=Oceanicoccus sagamiensis TaxID=716816 RepID=A0A1X9N6V9_9GAMM|nr:hypothetical protein [Oceanicoccus sagamiensis]ARN72894.1 hypothetical protein BST96_01490 [Oceanicoccus sagamiensis]
MTKTQISEQEKPNDFLFYSEGIRAMGEMMSLPFSLPLLRLAPKGDGHTVMIIPGFTADDDSTLSLRRFLSDMGYDVHGWGLGVNKGAREELFRLCAERIEALYKESGQKITLIGQSLGGIYARELAKLTPYIRQVICLGSPVDRRNGDGSRISALYEYMNREYMADFDNEFLEQTATAPDVPCSMVYSQLDGIVHWSTCRQNKPSDCAENIEVYSSHSGMGFSPAIYYLLTDRLAQKEGEWKPFNSPLWLKGAFPEHLH